MLALAFHPQGDRVATGSVDAPARLWDTSPGCDPPRMFNLSHTRPAGAVAFSPSGRHLAIGLGNGLIAVIRTPPAR